MLHLLNTNIFCHCCKFIDQSSNIIVSFWFYFVVFFFSFFWGGEGIRLILNKQTKRKKTLVFFRCSKKKLFLLLTFFKLSSHIYRNTVFSLYVYNTLTVFRPFANPNFPPPPPTKHPFFFDFNNVICDFQRTIGLVLN